MAQQTIGGKTTTQVKTTKSGTGNYQDVPPELQEDKSKWTFGRVVVTIVHGFAVIAIVLLTFRFFLLLFGASTTSGFVRFIYRSSDVVLAPFRGIFPVQQIEDSVHYLDFSALFAIVVYALLAYWMSSIVKKWERQDKLDEWNAQQQMKQYSSTTTTTTTKRPKQQ